MIKSNSAMLYELPLPLITFCTLYSKAIGLHDIICGFSSYFSFATSNTASTIACGFSNGIASPTPFII